MATLTIDDAERLATRVRPWTFRLEFLNNPGCTLYWYATGRGLTEAVEMGWGDTTATGTIQWQLTDWPGLRVKVADMLAQGYTYADTPFIRMTALSMARLGIGPAQAPVLTAAVPVSLTSAASLTSVVASPLMPPVTLTTPRDPALLALGHPWASIHHLKVLRNGLAILGWSAIDDNGKETMRFLPDEGIKFARDYNLETELV